MHEYMVEHGQVCRCIRCREVRAAAVEEAGLRLVEHDYETDITQEQFLSYETDAGQLAGFLRLSLPREEPGSRPGTSEIWQVLPEIAAAAMIRELHVYGPALSIGSASAGEAQHMGLGRGLIDLARQSARLAGFERLAVISAIGTHGYYESLGFERDGRYMVARL